MKILVTGVAGFIGSHLALRLLARGDTVVGIDNMNDYYDVTLKEARLRRCVNPSFTFERLDIVDRKGMAALFARNSFDAVMHLAAQAGVRYSIENPVSLYAATKKANELMAHTYASLYGLPCTGLRFFTVYGPWGRPDMALFKFTRGILEGERIPVFNRGEMIRDFTYVDDIVEGVIRTIDRPAQPDPSWSGDRPDSATSYAPYRVYNIGNNQPVELMRYIRVLEEALGRKADLELLPMQDGDVAATYADVDDLARDVGFRPNTPVEAGVARFVEWYRSYYGA